MIDIEHVRRTAYWIWRGLRPGIDLDDVQSEAVLAALSANAGHEVIAARRAIFNYLRREFPGSRGTGRMCLNTIWWMSQQTESHERKIIDADQRRFLTDAINTLTAYELAVIRSIFYDGLKAKDVASALGSSQSRVSITKRKALAKLREAIA